MEDRIFIEGIPASKFLSDLDKFIEEYKGERPLMKSPKGIKAVSDFFSIYERNLQVTTTPEEQNDKS